MNKVLVTGATGRLGANLVKELADKGYRVRSFVMPNDAKKGKMDALNTEIACGDLTDPESISRAVHEVDGIVHAACLMAKPREMSNAAWFDVNVKGTLHLLEAACQHKVERFVYISSTSVYGVENPKYLPIDEVHPQNPLSMYGCHKVLNERMVSAYHLQRNLSTVVLRPNYIMACDEVLGPWRTGTVLGILKTLALNPASALYVKGVEKPWEPLEKTMKNNDQLIIPRNLEGKPWKWHSTDVRDVVQGAVLALENEEAIGESFNICSLRPWGTWEDVVKHIAQKTGQAYTEVQLPNSWIFELSNDKAERLLGYRPRYDARRMIDSALEFRSGKDIGVIPP